MEKIKSLNKEIFVDSEEISQIVTRLAERINNDYKDKDPVFVVVLNGAFMFAADLLKQINVLSKITFIKLASYTSDKSSGTVKQLIGLNENLKGKDVVIIEDIVDTGLTMQSLRKQLLALDVNSLEIAVLMFKPHKFQCNYPIKYIGKEIEDPFIVGYGFDLDGYYRNLPAIYQVKE
ncbi:MAG: hypoxanthine phosphoribosyltransferase [Synergistales bacterium]|nr:hypoxanthine phosphoribosyltransferase [Bacteroidales bacterium]MDY6434729.1 hypoxanthine phosphoribosyltransferase [Synergistales bacterium]